MPEVGQYLVVIVRLGFGYQRLEGTVSSLGLTPGGETVSLSQVTYRHCSATGEARRRNGFTRPNAQISLRNQNIKRIFTVDADAVITLKRNLAKLAGTVGQASRGQTTLSRRK